MAMRGVVELPEIRIVQGEVFAQIWIFTEDEPEPETPIDMTEWAGEFRLGDLGAEAVFTYAPTMTDQGEILVQMTAAETLLLEPGTTYFQIDLTAPEEFADQLWQGRARVMPRVK
jgi:hypothetical protein